MNPEVEARLLEDIKVRMAYCRTVLDVPMYKKRAVKELRFLATLLNHMNTPSSLRSASYIQNLIYKAETGTYKLGD